MFEAYKVHVKIKLLDEVTGALRGIAQEFRRTGKIVDELNGKINRLRQNMNRGANGKGWQPSGGRSAQYGTMYIPHGNYPIHEERSRVNQRVPRKISPHRGHASFHGFHGFHSAVIGASGLYGMYNVLQPATDYLHILSVMNIQGMKQQEIAEATANAWQLASKYTLSTATGNLKAYIDLKNMFGSGKEALEYLPETLKVAASLAAATPISQQFSQNDIVYSLSKALEMRAANTNPEEFKKQAEMIAKVGIWSQGKVTPEDYRMMFKYGRQATMGLSDQFLYEEMPSLMIQFKSQRGGSGAHGGPGQLLASGYRALYRGKMSEKAYGNLLNLGLINPDQAFRTMADGTTQLLGGVKDANLFAYDPFQWVQKVLLPQIFSKYGDNISKKQLANIIGRLGLNQLATQELQFFAAQRFNIEKDARLIRKAKSADAVLSLALGKDPNLVLGAMSAQWDNLKTAFGMAVIPVIIPGIMKLTQEFNKLAEYFRKNKDVAKGLGIAFVGLASSLAISGTVLMLSGAFTALTSPLGLTVAGIAALAAGLYELNKHFPNFMSHVMPAPVSYNSKTKQWDAHLGGLLPALMPTLPGLSLITSSVANWWNGSNSNKLPTKSHPNPGKKGSASATQGAVYLDSHEVGNFMFGGGLDHFFRQHQLTNLGNFNLSLNPPTSDAQHAF